VTKRIVTGNQAIALGALRAGVHVVTGYPGTPSTGCIEHLLTMDLPDRHVEWSTNEKVAFEIAAGAAWAGHRALCTMKMSGVNVAYDALISIAYSGTNGGLVVYVADDPGVSAGMAEQDSRGFARMSQLPMLEPASPADAYELVQTAFALSEDVGSPVFVRLTTAVALGHTVVKTDEPVPPREIQPILEKDIARYTKAGSAICQQQHRDLIERLEKAAAWVHEKGLNRLELASKPGGLGIIASGAVDAYLPEALEASMIDQISVLHATTTVPFPWDETEQLLKHSGTILVLEELEPYMERGVYIAARHAGFDGRIIGKLNGTLSPIGEYSVAAIHKGLRAAASFADAARAESSSTIPQSVATEDTPPARESHPAILVRDAEGVAPAPRPITVCAGCPHRGTYLAIEAAIKKSGYSKDDVMVTGDIGCTILGMNPPFDLLWNEVSMGSSVSLAQGYVHAGLETPVIATIGDSTFFHGGIPGLVNAIQHRVPLTLVVMDNGWTAMTGMQINPGTAAEQQPDANRVDLEQVIRGLGPDHLTVVDPYDVEATTAAIVESLSCDGGVAVVIAQRECAIQAARRRVRYGTVTVDAEKCILCKQCLRTTGCPALSLPRAARAGGESSSGDDSPGERTIQSSDAEEPAATAGGSSTATSIQIDVAACNGCGVCTSFCPTDALKKESS
jgi:indolepyruvate ferredoxin oxidoreductase alpha subunit